MNILEKVCDLYKIDNLVEEGKTWLNYQHITESPIKINDEYNISYYLKDCDFFHQLKNALSFT